MLMKLKPSGQAALSKIKQLLSKVHIMQRDQVSLRTEQLMFFHVLYLKLSNCSRHYLSQQTEGGLAVQNLDSECHKALLCGEFDE